MFVVLRAVAVFALLFVGATHAQPSTDGNREGEVRVNAGQPWAWNDATRKWVGIEVFWEKYAARRGGLKWGRTDVWPPYEQLRERDLMIIELPQGACMMEFWHERWRLANDVRRWDCVFNEYGGCPHVFD